VLPVVMFPLAYASSQVVTLTAVTLVPFLVVVGLVTVAVVSVAGCLQPEDWIALEFVEDQIGLRVRTSVGACRNDKPGPPGLTGFRRSRTRLVTDQIEPVLAVTVDLVDPGLVRRRSKPRSGYRKPL